MSLLHELAIKHVSDKRNHIYSGQSYLDIYDEYLNATRLQAKCVLELGVYRGASLKMWADYFPNAQVWGIDVDPEAAQYDGERIHILTGSQADPAIVEQAAPGEMFDLVVDDGSHLVDHIIESHRLLWPRLNPGGHYFIEDLDCTYSDMTPHVQDWPGQRYNAPNTNFNNDRSKLDAYLMAQVKAVDYSKGRCFVHFWKLLCLLKKA